MLATPFRESLQCIRCGACLNACPVYRRIGGHAYGGVYSGPIGSILTPLYDSVAENPHLPHASSLCGACQAACPVKINIPHMLIGLRELQHHHEAEPLGGPGLPHLEGSAAPAVASIAWRCAARVCAAALQPRRLAGEAARPGRGLDGVRDFPAPAVRSFRERWREI